MYTQKQLIKFGLYAERAHRLAFDIALSAAELSQYGKGMAIIADETRNIGKQLYSLFDHDNKDEKSILDAILQLKYLSINGSLELMRIHESQLTLKKRLAVILEEIKHLTIEIEHTFGIKHKLPPIIPKVSNANTVLNDKVMFVVFTIGGITFFETSDNVLEIFDAKRIMLKNDFIYIRGEKFPLLNYYDILSIDSKESSSVLVVNMKYQDSSQTYAILTDDIPEFLNSTIGCHTESTIIPSKLVRECWDAEENRQILFLDYSNYAQNKKA